jgi:putative addiction module component (TIGR02574 family)
MSSRIEEIEKQVLALTIEERAQLVDKLWDSLGDTSYPGLSEAWQKEIDRRRREVMEGVVRVVPGEEVSKKARRLAEGQNE